MSFSKLGAIKYIASAIVGLGTSKIVSGAIKDHVKVETLIDKVTVVAASWVITGMATAATKKYSDEAIDGVVSAGSEMIKNFKTDAKLGKINRGESGFDAEGLDKDDFAQDEKLKWVRKPEQKAKASTLSTVKDMFEKAKAEGRNIKVHLEKNDSGEWEIVEEDTEIL